MMLIYRLAIRSVTTQSSMIAAMTLYQFHTVDAIYLSHRRNSLPTDSITCKINTKMSVIQQKCCDHTICFGIFANITVNPCLVNRTDKIISYRNRYRISLYYVNFILLASVRICVYVPKGKYTLGAKRPPLLRAKRPCARRFTPQICQLESCRKLAIIVSMDTSNLIYMSDMEMRLILFKILIESLASIHNKIPGICGQCFEILR